MRLGSSGVSSVLFFAAFVQARAAFKGQRFGPNWYHENTYISGKTIPLSTITFADKPKDEIEGSGRADLDYRIHEIESAQCQ